MAKTVPTFSIALTGEGVSPEKISVRMLSEVLAAVQTLVSGRDVEPEEDDQRDEAAENDALSLLDVKKGSAVFPCLARRPNAVDNLKRIGRFFDAPESTEDDRFSFTIRPIKILSNIARQLECRIELQTVQKTILAEINKGTYKFVSQTLLVTGPSSVSGTVKRVGGATDMRCALRVPGRERLLYCDVASADVSRRLGENLYQDVVVNGTATWFQRSWAIYAFKILDMRQLKRTSLSSAVKAIYEAGGKGWDSTSDPGKAIRELRM